MSKYPSQTQDKFTVRFPDGMRDAIAKRAEANGRSMNSEILQILQDALDAGLQTNLPYTSFRNSDDFNISPSSQASLIEALSQVEKIVKSAKEVFSEKSKDSK
ncbi:MULTISPECIES: Arc family DNA-binding protein [unclassified Providencia]|uniref:Arc family DNA-binding protein n=1 Tax=unclassified Providencia TaxID=2633465 RepID=UPI0012B58B93|nr:MULTISPECIES: Arc family DNA-binding protein [unclassified Providencia]MTC21806.1 Arc family DNA-binding protein [Providencia sp. wls1938]